MAHKALLVAADQYRDPRISPLPNTARDISEIERIFCEPPTRFASDGVEVFSQASARVATVRASLQRFLMDATQDDVLILYWAGHGALVGDVGYLIMLDTSMANIQGTAISMAEVRTLIDRSPARAVMACFDTCHSGAIARGAPVLRGLEIAGVGRVVIAACTHDQSAWDDPVRGHGVFTYHFIEGLQGQAANGNGDVGILGLYDYVCGRIQQEPNQQTPMLRCTLQGQVVLRRITSRQSVVGPLQQVVPAFQRVSLPFQALTSGLVGIPGVPLHGLEKFLYEYAGTNEHPVIFGGRQQEIEMLDEWLGSSRFSYAVLAAEAGRGKSALLAQWAVRLAINGDADVCFVPISIRFTTASKAATLSLLGARLRHLVHVVADPPRDWQGWLDEILLCLRQDYPDRNRPLLIIVDGADEATGWDFASTLQLPRYLGAGVKMIVSARGALNEWVQRLDVAEVETMVLGPLGRAEIQHIAMSIPDSPYPNGISSAMVEQLFRLTTGDPLLINLYMKEFQKKLAAGLSVEVDDLAGFRPGFQEYFRRWWREQQSQWGIDAERKRATATKILNVLSCALGPLYQQDVSRITEDVFDMGSDLVSVLEDLSRFVIGDGLEQGYVLVHPRLNVYFWDHMLPRERHYWEDRFVTYGRETVLSLHDGLTPPERVSEYVVRYYGAHLENTADHSEDLYALLSTEWLQLWIGRDGSPAGFLTDLSRAWERARKVQDHGVQVKCALIWWSIASMSGNIPARLVQRCLEARLIHPAQAIAWGRQSNDDYHRAEVFQHIVGSPLMGRVGRTAIFEAAQSIAHPICRALALLSISSHLNADEKELAMTLAIESIQSDLHGTHFRQGFDPLELIGEFAPPEAVGHCLEVVEKIPDVRTLVRTLTSLCGARVPGDIAKRAWARVEEISDLRVRMELFCELLPSLGQADVQPYLDQATELMWSIASNYEYFEYIPILRLTPAPEQLNVAKRILSYRSMSSVQPQDLEEVSRDLPAEVVTCFLDFVLQIPELWQLLNRLEALAPWLNGDNLQRAISVVMADTNPRKAVGLAALLAAPLLQGDQLANLVLPLVVHLDQELQKLVIGRLAPFLTDSQKMELLPPVIDFLTEDVRQVGNTLLLAKLMPILSSEQITRVLTRIKMLPDDLRKWVLEDISSVIPIEFLKDALDSAQFIQDVQSRYQVITYLIPYVNDHDRVFLTDKVLNQVKNRNTPYENALLLNDIARTQTLGPDRARTFEEAGRQFHAYLSGSSYNFNSVCWFLSQCDSVRVESVWLLKAISEILTLSRRGWAFGHLPKQLRILVLHLPPEDRNGVMKDWGAFCESLSDPATKAVELGLMASLLPMDEQAEMFRAALDLSLSSEVLEVLGAFIPSDIGQEIIDRVLALESVDKRLNRIRHLSRHASSDVIDRVRKDLQLTIHSDIKALSLCSFAPLFPEDQRLTAVHSALELLAIQQQWTAAEGLKTLVQGLDIPGIFLVLRPILERTMALAPHPAIHEVLPSLGPHLASWVAVDPVQANLAWISIMDILKRCERPYAVACLKDLLPFLLSLRNGNSAKLIADCLWEIEESWTDVM